MNGLSMLSARALSSLCVSDHSQLHSLQSLELLLTGMYVHAVL